MRHGASARPRRVALTLVRDLVRDYRPDDEAVLEHVYTSALVAEGLVHKTTRRGRFAELDLHMASEIASRFGHRRSIAVHDAGASSGITSTELYQTLKRHFADASLRVRLTASDLYDAIYIVELRRAPFAAVFDADRQPMQYVGLGFVLTAHGGKYQEGRWYPVNRALKRCLDRSLLPRARRLLANVSFANIDGQVDRREGRVLRVPLIHPECLRLTRADAAFSFRRQDIFLPAVETYQVVRAMNVLNPGYFGDEQLRKGVRAILASLEEGGVFIVGRTVSERDQRTHASAFVRAGNRFVPAWHVHGGSEIAELVCSVEAPATWDVDSWALA